MQSIYQRLIPFSCFLLIIYISYAYGFLEICHILFDDGLLFDKLSLIMSKKGY